MYLNWQPCLVGFSFPWVAALNFANWSNMNELPFGKIKVDEAINEPSLNEPQSFNATIQLENELVNINGHCWVDSYL